MKIQFPKTFEFGTSTCAYQIETAFQHDWQNLKSRDGHTLSRTTDHELRISEDVDILSSLAPNYRMSLMWSKLQREPFADFEPQIVEEYTMLLEKLKGKGLNIMMVLHHFANPIWFSQAGGWSNSTNILAWVDYAKKLVRVFGNYISSWNTFNEPNLYATMGWLLGEFPPGRKNPLTAVRVIRNIAKAHDEMYGYIKSQYPEVPVGISHNCAIFEGHNVVGWVPAKLMDAWFMNYAASLFSNVDFFGMSYYARIAFDPFPITAIERIDKMNELGMKHDDMWEYYPNGLKECIIRFWKQFGKPIIITENGLCTTNDSFRVRALKDYMQAIHTCLEQGIDIRGYYHWSPWDNFEWTLGPTYRFGLYECDLVTKDRRKKPSADVYSRLAYDHEIDIE